MSLEVFGYKRSELLYRFIVLGTALAASCGGAFGIYSVRNSMGAAPALVDILESTSLNKLVTASLAPRIFLPFSPLAGFEPPLSLPGKPRDGSRAVDTVSLTDSAELAQEFDRIGYRLEAGGDAIAVPRILVTALPGDLPQIDDVDLRKTLFFQVLLPLVLEVNESLLEQRQRLLKLRDELQAGEGLAADEEEWLEQVAASYGVDPEALDELVDRVDIIPPSLALAQAAVESGWGTSRVALEGNALFGQYAMDDDAPDAEFSPNRPEMHLRSFGGLLQAVLAYAHNLNTHAAYGKFRALRAAARGAGQLPDGYALAGTLTRYSERGKSYIRDVRRLLRANDLDAFDHARLTGGRVTRVVFNET